LLGETGKYFDGIFDTVPEANKYVPEMHAAGADIIVIAYSDIE
jgi:2',3'-cyclic-nucleotide 2'-phosphodiesterase (5'-nucleotidase family)